MLATWARQRHPAYFVPPELRPSAECLGWSANYFSWRTYTGILAGPLRASKSARHLAHRTAFSCVADTHAHARPVHSIPGQKMTLINNAVLAQMRRQYGGVDTPESVFPHRSSRSARFDPTGCCNAPAPTCRRALPTQTKVTTMLNT